VAPEREDIAQQIKDLSGKESEWVTGQNVSVLIDSGEQLAGQGDYTGAAGKFSTALKLESTSTAAAQGLDVAVESLLQRALEGIEKGDFSSARDDLTDAEEFAPTREDIADQIAQLPAAEQAWQYNQALKQGIEEAEAFYKKGQLSNAAKAYSEVLAVDPESSVASEGFDKSITALIDGAKSSTKKGDFTRARNNLASAENLAPGNADAARLLADIPRLEQEWQKEQAAAAQQQQLATELASTVESAMAVNDLYSAADNYSELAATFPDLASTRKLKRELVSAFADATRTQISDEDYDAARAYLSRGQVLEPNHADWGELEDEIEISTSGNRRRLGAF
jgi:tetratricopeptide (TPR) repeat protein